MSSLEDGIRELAIELDRSTRVAALTGAGVSAESGVPTFRGEDGLWKGHDPTRLATPQAFAADPALVWEWYDWRRTTLAGCEPNPGHGALAGLEELIRDFTLITQNVDRFHQQAGSSDVLELHGDIWTLKCAAHCGHAELDERTPMPKLQKCPGCGAWLRPGVVWFGEGLPPGTMERAARAARDCQVFLVVGTSSVVYPAAGLADLAGAAGARVFEINPHPASRVQGVRVLKGPSGEILPAVVQRLRERRGEENSPGD